MLKQTFELRLESPVLLRRAIVTLQVEDQRHQGLGDVAAAEGAEMAAVVGAGAKAVGSVGHRPAALRNAAILSTSLTPGARSTPEETSRSGALVAARASATLEGVRPPAIPQSIVWRWLARRVQSKRVPVPPGSACAGASKSRRSTIPSYCRERPSVPASRSPTAFHTSADTCCLTAAIQSGVSLP